MSRKTTNKKQVEAPLNETFEKAPETSAERTVPAEPAAEPTAQAADGTSGEQRQWSDPYKAIVTTKHFEMGEHRRFKQRMFKFSDKPAAEILAALKENGFIYRPEEKTWTIAATPANRILADDLAQQFAGEAKSPAR